MKRNVKAWEIAGVDSKDYPDFVDAYVSWAVWDDDTELTDEELEALTDSGFAQRHAFETLLD